MVLGVLLMVAGTVGFFVGTYVFGTRLVDSAADAIDLRANLVTEMNVPGSEDVALDQETYRVVAFGPKLTHNVPSGPVRSGDAPGTTLEALPFPQPRVSVTGPDGQPVPLEEAFTDSVSNTDAYDAVVIGEFTVSEAGTYTISTERPSRQVTTVGVGTGIDLEETVDSVIGGGLVIAATIGAGGLGFLVLLGGIIWFAVRGSSHSHEHDGPPPPPPGYGPLLP